MEVQRAQLCVFGQGYSSSSASDTPGPVWRNSQGTRTWLLLWKTGAALFLMKSSSRGSAALGSKKVCGSGFSGSGFSGSLSSLAFLFKFRKMGWRGLRLHGRSVRGGFAAIQPLHQAMLQVRRRVVFTRGLLAGLDEFFKDGQSLLAADAVVGQYVPHVVQGLEHASPHSHGVRKGGRQHQVHCRLARLALALGSSRHRRACFSSK